ncbi:DUF6765 family protein [Massilia sp. Se16.2.3]|uniref:DUF6765 family protein n=1 Tax=Massilia sp. Se16.2.3 TaxID=2709303 RepID=UPI001602D18A|nr:DUF6765 family protein [Massilia sp. Se16.2.3]QNA99629.1 RHS repeat protein [Massilia sp. Se16.2.3]
MSTTTSIKALVHTALSALLFSGGAELAHAGIPGIDPPSGCGVNMSCVPGTPTPPFTPPGTTPPGTHPPGTCGPGNSGSPCAAPGPATNPGSGNGEINVGAGNPINIITGNKYQREVDMAPLPGVLGLEIVRHYNSSISGPGASTNLLGRGWKLSYETDLYVVGRTVQIVQADGSRIIFNRDARDPSLCASTNPSDGKVVVRKTPKGEEYVWHWTNGRELSFDSRGKLVQILAPGGQFVSLQHDARGMLVSVTDPQGRRLQLQYLDKAQSQAGNAFRGVQSIVSPVGTFHYRYGSPLPKGAEVSANTLLANLVKVDMPTGARYYHYENAKFPTYLTGISELATNARGKADWQRVSTYGYDDNGKGNLSVKGYPARLARGADGKVLQPARLAEGTGVQQITLEHGAGSTTLTNSLGQKTVYRYAIIGGQYRLLEALGAGCATCGETNVRYGYDAEGRVTASMMLDEKGTVLSAEGTQYDAQGRARQLISYSFVNGRSLPGKVKMRYEYEGDKPWPARIVRPSVVPGKEYVTTIKYADSAVLAGLPTEISEEGHMPTLEGNASAGTIARTLRYRYDGYGQRVEIDGPLANAATNPGPLNSDITRTRFDARTKLALRTEAPGGPVTEVLERDAALRPTVTRFTDPSGVQMVRVRYNWRGQPEEMRVEGTPADGGPVLSQTMRYTYDLNGRLIEATLPGELSSRFTYDAAGRMTRKLLPDGSAVEAAYNSEGRRILAAVRRADGERAGLTHYRLDEHGRVAGMEDGLGVVANASFTSAGTVAEITNPLGVATRFSYDENGMLTGRTDAAGTPNAASINYVYDARGRRVQLTDPNGVKTLRRYDDFGRPMLETNPDRGVTLYLHDAAGRMLVRSDARGHDTRYRYDVQGHVIAVGTTAVPELTRYRYVGRRLVEIVATPDGKPEHATERTSYRYDAFGQVLEENRWFAKADVKNDTVGLRFVTTSTYDEAGRLSTQVLPDGHVLRYRYGDKNGMLKAMYFDDEPVVANIARGPTGITAFESGNGVRQTIERDAGGRITAVRAIGTAVAAEGWMAKARTWFGGSSKQEARAIYAQENRYDRAGRLVQIGRQLDQAGALPARSVAEHYGYDALDRLTDVGTGDAPSARYAYDKGGNRIEEWHASAVSRVASSGASVGDAGGTRAYLYAPGTNRLVGLTRPLADSGTGSLHERLDKGTANLFESAWLYRAGGAPFARIGFTASGLTNAAAQSQPASRRIAYDIANRPMAVYDGADRLVAAYAYNVQGERFAKTVYPAAQPAGIVRTALPAQARGTTTYSLYRDQRLAAEADGEGHIVAHYLYLDGKPVARVDMRQETGVFSRLWQRIRALGASRGQQPSASGSAAAIYAIHTDHLGTPQAVTDAGQDIVWQGKVTPFGQATVVHASMNAANGKAFEMKLRLPGQVFDAETGLNQNYFRDYDPALGRYTTPDPMGLAGGINPFAYAEGNPLGNTDPLGLYSIEVHYYMTFFLARVAGIDFDTALTIAQATQHIDEDPDTWPMDENAPIQSNNPLTSDARNRLQKYHFTTSSPDWLNPFDYDPPRTLAEKAFLLATGMDLDSYIKRRYENPSNPQLTRLMNASNRAPTACAKAQFFGEYLHAFEDTFAHRTQDNSPIRLNLNTGHLWWGHSPDLTYNHTVIIPENPAFIREIGIWDQNEARTYTMEKEVFAKMQQFGGGSATNAATGQPIKFGDLTDFLRNWNQIHDDGNKISALRAQLSSFGLGTIPDFDNTCATAKRRNYLGGLNQSTYDGTILPTGTATDAQLAQACGG